MAQQTNPTPLPRNSESLRYVIESVRTVNSYGKFSPKQQEVYNLMENFFAPELDEAMNYLKRLPTYRNCGGMEGRRQLLKQEAELVILECMQGVTNEEIDDFESCIEGFRSKIRELFNKYTNQASRESFHVDVKKNTKTNENEQCVVVANRVDITDNIARETADSPLEDAAEEFMEQSMGQYQAL